MKRITEAELKEQYIKNPPEGMTSSPLNFWIWIISYMNLITLMMTILVKRAFTSFNPNRLIHYARF